jgi:hypothetical protein
MAVHKGFKNFEIPATRNPAGVPYMLFWIFYRFFSFCRRIFCADTAHFVDVPIKGYFMP